MFPAAVHYREFAPCEALREHVRAFFSFAPPLERAPGSRPLIRELRFGEGDLLGAPALADGHVSLAFSFEQGWACDGHWRRALSAPRGDVIGPMSAVGATSLDQIPEAVGVFLRAGHACALIGAPPAELADRVVALEDLWGAAAAGLPAELAAAPESARINRLESVLLRRLVQAPAAETALNAPGLAQCILRGRGRLKIERLADAAGVSRQHLTRSFREAVGVTPKLFARLARFQAGLAYAGCGAKVDWPQAALELGYADQSHMIAEFREFSSLTPQTLARQRWFHPFIERARSVRGRDEVSSAYSRPSTESGAVPCSTHCVIAKKAGEVPTEESRVAQRPNCAALLGRCGL